MNKRILFYGDSNTWGYRPGGERLPANRRYTTMVTRQAPDIIPVVDGLNGRSTAFESSLVPPELLGGATFAASLRKADNPDGLVVMLGTNDVMPPLSLDAETVGDNMRRIIRTAREICPGMGIVVIVSPPPLAPCAVRAIRDDTGCDAELLGTNLAPFLRKAADAEGASFLSGESIIPYMDAQDGFHLNDIGHLRIGLGIGSLLRSLTLPH